MSFVSQKFYNIQCDRCGICLDDMWYDDKQDVEDWAKDNDWITHKRKRYCPDCYEIDDDDNIVIKPPLENADL